MIPQSAVEHPRGKGIWSQQTMRRRAIDECLFSDEVGKCLFDTSLLDAAGYLLQMGKEVYVTPAKADTRQSICTLLPDEAFLIPPGQFAFLLTEEIVRVPTDAYAFISLRSTTKFKGLVNVSGFHADPGFEGRLVFAVFNAAPGDVHLRRGEALFMITMADLDEPSVGARKNEPRQLKIPLKLIMPLAGEVQSFAGLKDHIDELKENLDGRLRDVERELAVLRWAGALVLGALITLVARAFILV